MNPGYLAAVSFILFTGLGACLQVLKLFRRTQAWKSGELERAHICDGLHPVREMWSYSAFLLFALSGITRSYIDLFLLLSRLPVVLLSTVILWFLQAHGIKGARKFFLLSMLGDIALGCAIAFTIFGTRLHASIASTLVDGALSIVSFLLFYGKQLQAVTMYRQRKSAAVSWARELGLVIKDATGFWYSFSVGPELMWVSVTHVLSGISSASICLSKYLVERRLNVRESSKTLE